MAVCAIQHPHWGYNFANQLFVKNAFDNGEDGKGYKTVTVRGIFGGKKQKKEFVGKVSRPATDDDSVVREFWHRCGLLKIVMTPHRDGPMFVAFLDGHVASNFVSDKMEFHFAPDDLKDNEGKPIAEVWFYGRGRRHGPLYDYSTSRIICTFADKEQMDQYLDLTNRRMPKSITHRGVTYSLTSSGAYQSSDGNILPDLLLMYFLLSANEQHAFVAQNPEVQSMLGDTTQNTTTTDDLPHDGNPTPADGANYSNDGDHSGSTDFGESGTDDGGDGGGSDGGGGGE